VERAQWINPSALGFAPCGEKGIRNPAILEAALIEDAC